MVSLCNQDGIVIMEFRSDAEAVRWWRERGRSGDRIKETGELLSDVDALLRLED